MNHTEEIMARRNNLNKVLMEVRKFEEPVYTTGVAAKKLGVSPHTIRLYESEGLIISYRTDTCRRLYSEMEIEKIKGIRGMIQIEGHNFEDIRRIMAMVPCWKIRGCAKEVREFCSARKARKKPCWNYGSDCSCRTSSCRECQVYQNIINSEDIHSLIDS